MELWLKILLIVLAVIVALILLSFLVKMIIRLAFNSYLIIVIFYKIIKGIIILATLLFGILYFTNLSNANWNFELLMIYSFICYFGLYFIERIINISQNILSKN